MRQGCLIAGAVLVAMLAASCWAFDPQLAVARAGFDLGRELAAMLAKLLEALADALRTHQW